MCIIIIVVIILSISIMVLVNMFWLSYLSRLYLTILPYRKDSSQYSPRIALVTFELNNLDIAFVLNTIHTKGIYVYPKLLLDAVRKSSSLIISNGLVLGSGILVLLIVVVNGT